MRLPLRLLLLLALPFSLPAQARLTTPEQALGFKIGADYQLATYTQLQRWWEKLAVESPRMELDTIGTTAEGRPQLMAILSSPANLGKLEEYRKNNALLAAGRVDEATARRLAANGKSIIWIDGGLHATEVLGAQQLLEMVWQFVSQDDAETTRILDDVIILVAHANPDGMELVSSWYMRKPDTLQRNMGDLPRLYQKYVGHDNNRDFYRNAQAESRNISRTLYRTWFPQVIYNHHQTGPAGSVMFAPPFRDPFNYVFDPMIPTGLDFVAMGMQRRFASEGKPGVVSREASSYSTWWNGGLRTAGYFHNMIGILTETIGSPTPTTIPLVLARQLPSGSGQFPIAPQVWRFRQSIDYSMTANRAILDYASRYREELLFDFWQMGRNSIARGQTDTWTTTPVSIDAARAAGTSTQAQAAALRNPARRDPRAYVLPANQAEIGNALDFLQALSTSGIEVQKATAEFSIGSTRYPKGSFVVRADQAFRPHVLDMFEPQWHPTDLQYPGGPPKRPYDNAGYTLAYQMGVSFDRILDPFQAPLAPITSEDIRPDAAAFDTKAKAWRIPAGATDGFVAVNRLLKAKQKVERLPNGDFLVPASSAAAKVLSEMARDRALPTTATTLAQRGTAVTPLRIGLWDRYGGSMESGWTRWILEQYEMPFTVVYAPTLDAGNLRQQFDVLLFVNGAIPGTGGGRGAGGGGGGGGGRVLDPMTLPAEYRNQLGNVSAATTVPQIKSFLEQGGRVVAIGSSATNLAAALTLPIESQIIEKQANGTTRPISSDKFYIPGSVLVSSVDTTVAVARGARPATDVFFDNSPVWRLLPDAAAKGVTPIARYTAEKPLRSGWAIGQEYLKDGVAMAQATVGQGTLYLYGPEVLFRAQPAGTYRFVFNTFYR
ncbi:MAG: peptidase [Gemmatimonadales bacterium]|nr:peptidase [Gemmatimonadales bacterium]MBP6570970.1 peptidase [Gemmatimonadales bacterium]MBP7621807.1 peptidase [Gemmatimonadales bacterium]